MAEINDAFEIPLEEEEEVTEEEVPSDEAEEITPEEAPQSDIVPTVEEDTGHLASVVCEVCLELNLTTKSVIKCARCDKAFCFHFASSIDPQYCVNCMSDMSVTKQTITKTYEHKNEETGQIAYYRRKAREIKIEGLDWLFAQRKITELSDTELDLAIEYHRNIYSLMLTEQERRRNEKMHRYAGITVKIPTHSTSTGTKSSSTVTTTVKKTRTVSKDKAAEQVAALLRSMLAKGLKPEDIARMMKK